MIPENHIAVLCPVRNREWILSHWLDNVEMAAKECPIPVSLFVVVNDSEDKTKEFLYKRKIHRLKDLRIWEKNLGVPREGTEFDSYCRLGPRIVIYQALETLRNFLVDQYLSHNYSHAMIWDSDILTSPSIFSKLLSRDKEIVSAVVREKSSINVVRESHTGGFPWEKYFDHPTDRLFECDWTGALTLIARKVFESGVRFKAVSQKIDGPLCGEDLGFSLQARLKGFHLWADPTVKTEHVMHPTRLQEALKNLEMVKA